MCLLYRRSERQAIAGKMGLVCVDGSAAQFKRGKKGGKTTSIPSLERLWRGWMDDHFKELEKSFTATPISLIFM